MKARTGKARTLHGNTHEKDTEGSGQQPESVNIHRAQRRQLDMRNDGKAHEGKRHKRINAVTDAQSIGRLFKIRQSLLRRFGVQIAHQAGKRQRQLADNLPMIGQNHTAACLLQAQDGAGHVAVVCAGDDNVVGIVRNGGGNGAGAEPVTFEVANADMAGCLVALDDGKLEQAVAAAEAVPSLVVTS